jgi:hypothetical protein
MGCVMALRAAVRIAIVSAFLLWSITFSVGASAADADALRGEIEAYFKRLGYVDWDGADTFTVREDGDEAVAVIENGRFLLRQEKTKTKPGATITVDRVEIRRKSGSGGGDNVTYRIFLPAKTTFAIAEGPVATLTLDEAMVTALVSKPGDWYQNLAASLSGGHIERIGTADSVKFGPMTTTTKITPTDNGGWTGPIAFELKGLEFLFADEPLAGRVERIGYTGEAGGSSLSALHVMRDQLAELREKSKDDPAAVTNLWIGLLPKVFEAFDHSKGELVIEGVTAKRPDSETLVTLAKATIGGGVTGLGSDNATLRWTYGHEGLAIAPSLVAEPQVPRRLSIDIGLENIASAPLRQMLRATSKAGPGASDADKQGVPPQIIGAAMALQPLLRIYGITVEFKEARIDATAEAKRAPPMPFGYSASGDVTVHGFDALPSILTDDNDRNHLPLLKFIGQPETDADGAKVMKFHLAAESGKPITFNGSDLSDWFAGAGQFGRMPAGPPRLLRLADPLEKGGRCPRGSEGR